MEDLIQILVLKEQRDITIKLIEELDNKMRIDVMRNYFDNNEEDTLDLERLKKQLNKINNKIMNIN